MKAVETKTGLEVAVIGMAGRFPGAGNLREFWNNMKNGVESICFLSDKELAEAGTSPRAVEDDGFVKAKGVLEDAGYFDASFFDYLPVEAGVMDPQVRIFHQCVWSALEDAGYDPGSYKGRIGLYAGASNGFYWQGLMLISGKGNVLDTFSVSQLKDKDYLSTRVSYRLNLKGPAITVHTACSTSLVVIHLAVQGVLNGECEMALAGGVSIMLPQRVGYFYREGMIMSPDGHCRAFAKEAQGTVAGEGAGVVVLKPLEDAAAADDHIYAVIKGSVVNNDGIRKVGFSAPSVEGQAETISAAQFIAEVEPESISYIEAHGTGTVLGDPIEIEALKLAFNTGKKSFCGIGSVKGNIGHLDAAAGVAGFIKTVLAIHHQRIPPSLHFESPNPKIDFDGSPFYVNTRLQEWKTNGYPLRAGVSSFGIGGTNAHVILEEPPARKASSLGRTHQLMVLSAKTAAALNRTAENLAEYLKQNPGVNLTDVEYTLQRGRHAFDYRKMIVCADVHEAIRGLTSPAEAAPRRVTADADKIPVVFMFPGQGSQYVNMGLELYQKEPLFREEMDRCFDILTPLMGHDIKTIIYPSSGDSAPSDLKIDQTEFTQPVIFVFEYALAKLLMKWGIQPQAMIGHSIGEYLAAHLAGVFSLEAALELVALRGRLMQKIPAGAMLSVPLSEEKLKLLLKPGVSLAAVNSPSHCVVSGTGQAIAAVAKELAAKGCQTRPIHTSHAFHSAMMEPILTEFNEAVKKIKLNQPQKPYISNASGTWISGEEPVNPRYWTNHLRHTIRFSQGLKELLRETDPILVEVGPGKTLTTFARQHMDKNSEQRTLNLVRHPQEEVSDMYYLLNKIGHLWLYGKSIDWSEFHYRQKRLRVSLPTYPFDGQHFPIEGDPFKLAAEKAFAPPRLAKKPDMADWFYVPSWERLALPQQDTFPSKDRWLVFMDETGWGANLLKRLEEEQQEVITVNIGTEFAGIDDQSFVISPPQEHHYDDLFKELGRLNKIPGKIVHLWNITPRHQKQLELKHLDWSQDLGFYSLLNIVRATGRERIVDEIQMVVVTNNMQEVMAGELRCPEKATVLGAVKIIPLEYPNIQCKSIDIVLSDPETRQEMEALSHLMAELTSDTDDCFVAYRGNYRWVSAIKPVRLTQSSKGRKRLKEKGVYLITGGLGGIGFSLAEDLAKSLKARLILIGRSGFPVREDWGEWLAAGDNDTKDHISQKIRKIQELEARGAEFLVASADVSDLEGMKNVIVRAKEKFGTINGVIHSAGIADYEGVIQRRTKEMTEKIMAPKVKGTLVLDYLLKDSKLDFFALCSSIGNVLYGIKFGQVGYNAANEFLVAYASYKASRDNTFITAINWNDWLEVGMSVEAVKKRHADEGNGDNDQINVEAELHGGLTPAEGVTVFHRILESTLSNVTVSTLDLNIWARQLNRPKGQETPLAESRKETVSPAPMAQRPNLTTPYTAPGNDTEQALAEIFQKFFGIEPVGIYDDFFELGGDSLKAMSIAAIIHKNLEVRIPLQVFFSSPTVESLHKYIKSTKKEKYISIEPVEKKECYSLSSAQKRLYILYRMDEENISYSISLNVMLEGDLDKNRLENMFEKLIRRHEGLRTSFRLIHDNAVQEIHPPDGVDFALEYYNPGSSLNNDEVEMITRDFVRPFDLAQVPIMRVGLIKLGHQRHLLMVNMHHIISDLVSMELFINEGVRMYRGEELPLLRLHYKDFSQWQNRLFETGAMKRQEEYWLSRFKKGEVPELNLAAFTDYPRTRDTGSEGETIHFEIDRRLTEAVKRMVLETGATLYILLLAVYTLLLSKYTGQEDIVVGSGIAGRRHPDLDPIIGMFVNMLAMRNQPTENKTFSTFLEEVKVNALDAYENQDYQFDELVATLGVKREFGRTPLFDATFTFQSVETSAQPGEAPQQPVPQEGPQLAIKAFPQERHLLQFDLTLHAADANDRIMMTLFYITSLFKPSTAREITKHYIEILKQVVEKRDVKMGDITISHGFLVGKSHAPQEEYQSFEF